MRNGEGKWIRNGNWAGLNKGMENGEAVNGEKRRTRKGNFEEDIIRDWRKGTRGRDE